MLGNGETQQAIRSFAALAQDTRLAVIRALVVAGDTGMAAGQIGEALGVSAPTLSFHLKELENAGLVRSRRESRQIFYTADFQRMRDLIGFLWRDCCRGGEACDAPAPASVLTCGAA
ncbi:MAG TPA: metalloregulator ArsR/SmtB family transcription factor [Micropepsaceae bacterium]|nr:metalloregulator ArsR/SmtB family transcription factor [Micropepsaceae bacterium]HRK70437.1 metalloregulator ArsR/SmtB family transcription factor [Micropepsaceae bacterium]